MLCNCHQIDLNWEIIVRYHNKSVSNEFLILARLTMPEALRTSRIFCGRLFIGCVAFCCRFSRKPNKIQNNKHNSCCNDARRQHKVLFFFSFSFLFFFFWFVHMLRLLCIYLAFFIWSKSMFTQRCNKCIGW